MRKNKHFKEDGIQKGDLVLMRDQQHTKKASNFTEICTKSLKSEKAKYFCQHSLLEQQDGQ